MTLPKMPAGKPGQGRLLDNPSSEGILSAYAGKGESRAMTRTPLCWRASLLIVSRSFDPAGFPAQEFGGTIRAREETGGPPIAGLGGSCPEEVTEVSRA